MLPFRFFIYYYLLCLFFCIPLEIILHNIYKIYEYNIILCILVIIISVLYCIWYNKYSLNKSLLSKYKTFEIITDFKEINYKTATIFFSIKFCIKMLICLIIVLFKIDHYINALIITLILDIADYFTYNIFFMNKIKTKKKEIDSIKADVF